MGDPPEREGCAYGESIRSKEEEQGFVVEY